MRVAQRDLLEEAKKKIPFWKPQLRPGGMASIEEAVVYLMIKVLWWWNTVYAGNDKDRYDGLTTLLILKEMSMSDYLTLKVQNNCWISTSKELSSFLSERVKSW